MVGPWRAVPSPDYVWALEELRGGEWVRIATFRNADDADGVALALNRYHHGTPYPETEETDR